MLEIDSDSPEISQIIGVFQSALIGIEIDSSSLDHFFTLLLSNLTCFEESGNDLILNRRYHCLFSRSIEFLIFTLLPPHRRIFLIKNLKCICQIFFIILYIGQLFPYFSKDKKKIEHF